MVVSESNGVEAAILRRGQPSGDEELLRHCSDGEVLALVLDEANHRIRNSLSMVEALVRQTQSTTVEEYRAALTARICALKGLYEVICRSAESSVGLAELMEQTMRPYCARGGGGVRAAGPDVRVEPKLALALHLVLHELAANASKYGALSIPSGCIKIQWNVWQIAPGARKLTVAWTERGGPEVKVPCGQGFGTQLIKRALDGYGQAQLEFHSDGLACHMLIDLGR